MPDDLALMPGRGEAGSSRADGAGCFLQTLLAGRGSSADLEARLGTTSFIDLLTALEAAFDAPDRRGAIKLYRAWIGANPHGGAFLPAAWFNLGVELSRNGDRRGAAEAYRTVLSLKPDFHHAAVNLGLIQEAEGRPDAALATWTGALQPDDARIALLNQSARLLEKAGRLAEAERTLRASLLTSPAQPDAIQHWVHLRQRMCQWPILAGEAVSLPEAELIADCGPLAALALTDRVAAQTAITARWLARKTFPVAARLSPERGYGHDRLRIGYMSSDFGRHAMSYLIAELLEQHDRGRFEVHGYCLGQDDGSDIQARVRRSFDRFVQLRNLSDEGAARVIAADEIDILVDLNGLTAGARPQILRWRPAPIQASYLGFIGPVPLPELDHLFCDEYVVPQALAPLYYPRPLSIATVYQANDNRRVVGPPTTRAAHGLPEDAFVFCCCSNHYKVTQAMFTAWMVILGRVPNSVLWLAADNEWSQRNLQAEAGRLGVDPGRLLFADRTNPASYIRRLGIADLYLDTFPYAAGTIASNAIRMGLPIVTLRGEAFASRMAARLLDAVGAHEGVADTLAGYVYRAVALGTQPDAYVRYRSLFTEQAWQATIGNTARFVSEYEATLLGLHSRLRQAAGTG